MVVPTVTAPRLPLGIDTRREDLLERLEALLEGDDDGDELPMLIGELRQMGVDIG